METHFQFFEDEKLFIVSYIGEFSIDKYSQQVNEVTNSLEWSFVEKILVDMRSTNFNMPLDKINDLVEIKENKLNKKETITIHLVDSPSETVASHLYQAPLKEKNFNLNYCSTVKKAKDLLNFSKSADDLELRINNLKHRF